jgi:hypothetical protein
MDFEGERKRYMEEERKCRIMKKGDRDKRKDKVGDMMCKERKGREKQ